MATVTSSGRINVAANSSVVRIGRCLRVRMAVDASEHLVVGRVRMAISATRPDLVMRAGVNRELAMRESGAGPCCRCVAVRAGGRKSGRRVVRVVGGRVFGLMARVAVRRRARKDVVHMAACAGRVDVRAGERELGGAVIECGRRPGCSGVAHLAGLGKSRGRMGRIVGSVEVGQVARDASRGQGGELTIGVAGRTGQWNVGAHQRKLRVVVVEHRVEPVRGGMAHGAIRGERRGEVVRIQWWC